MKLVVDPHPLFGNFIIENMPRPRSYNRWGTLNCWEIGRIYIELDAMFDTPFITSLQAIKSKYELR